MMSLLRLRASPGPPSHDQGHGGETGGNSTIGGGHGPVHGEGGDPNRRLSHLLVQLYPKYAVYLLVSFIFLATFINFTSSAYTRYVIWRSRDGTRRSGDSRPGRAVDGEAQSSYPTRRNVSLRRLPHAFLNLTRILAFRVTIPVGFGVHLTSTEILIPAAHFAVLMIFEFINCTSLGFHQTYDATDKKSIGLNTTTGKRYDPMYWANRAGSLTISHITFIVALAGKNNIITRE